jgi:hypothetical protein
MLFLDNNHDETLKTADRLALLFARIMSIAWFSYTIWRTRELGRRTSVLIAGTDSACKLDIFTPYFKSRTTFQVTACSRRR